MFKALLKPIFELFDRDMLPELDNDEKDCIDMKHSSILRLIGEKKYFFNEKLREGVKLIPTGGRFGNGRIIMTKNVHEESFKNFLTQLVDWLGRFPGKLSLDAHGFVETSKGEPIFIFGSVNSSILLWNEKQSVLLDRNVILTIINVKLKK